MILKIDNSAGDEGLGNMQNQLYSGTEEIENVLQINDTNVRDELIDEFTIVFDEKKISNLSIDKDEYNKELMYLLREEFLSNPETKEFFWIPQALEGYCRAKYHTRLGSFGKVKGIKVNKKIKSIQIIAKTDEIITEKDESGDINFKSVKVVKGNQLSFEELDHFAIEKKLTELEIGIDLPRINYSDEMVDAIEKLSPSSKYQRDIIARTSLLKSTNPEIAKQGNIDVRLVREVGGFGSLSGISNGCGVFVDDGNEYHNKFSVIKVVDDGIPFTEAEKNILGFSRGAKDLTNSNEKINDLWNTMLGIMYDVGQNSKPNSEFGRILNDKVHTLKKFLDNNGWIFGEYKRLIDEMNNIHTKYSGLDKKLHNAVLKAKLEYRNNEKPFEFIDVSEDIEKAKQSYTEQIEMFKKIIEFLKKHNDVFKNKMIEKGSKSKSRLNFLSNIDDQLKLLGDNTKFIDK